MMTRLGNQVIKVTECKTMAVRMQSVKAGEIDETGRVARMYSNIQTKLNLNNI